VRGASGVNFWWAGPIWPSGGGLCRRRQEPGPGGACRRGDHVHVEARGSLAVGGPPMRQDSLFRIASTSKPITCFATVALVREGLIAPDEPVERLLPELANPKVLWRVDGPLGETTKASWAITVRDLLTFTFGFGMVPMRGALAAPEHWPVVDAAADLHLCTLGWPNPPEQPGPDDWMANLGSLPLLAQPGERWLYNTGASVLGVLLARAARVLQTRVFGRLGMRDTAFFTSDASRLATLYLSTPEGDRIWDAPDGKWSRPPAFPDGASGLVSTADDLLALAPMFLREGDPVLTSDQVREMARDQLTTAQKGNEGELFDDHSWSYCQAVVAKGPNKGAFGWDGGFGVSWLVDPRRGLVVIVLTQRITEHFPLRRQFQAAAYSALP
jgi:CubicO group peptidase (beta-lactamase class C family)